MVVMAKNQEDRRDEQDTRPGTMQRDEEQNEGAENEQKDEAQAGTEQEAEQPPEEVLGLRAAIEKVMSRIEWHQQQIGNLQEEIKNHEQEIVDLRASLEENISPLMAKPANGDGKAQAEAAAQQRQTWKGHKQARTQGGATTGELIREALKGGKTLNTEEIKAYLEKKGNTTNPSVELSRMVKKNVIERSGRAEYKLVEG
jgi:uncharacterized coiled-coil DUF342 family protein